LKGIDKVFNRKEIYEKFNICNYEKKVTIMRKNGFDTKKVKKCQNSQNFWKGFCDFHQFGWQPRCYLIEEKGNNITIPQKKIQSESLDLNP